jgi:hypothetical protein
MEEVRFAFMTSFPAWKENVGVCKVDMGKKRSRRCVCGGRGRVAWGAILSGL